MYESPIELKIDNIVSEVSKQVNEYTLRCFQQIGVNVDKYELIKALEYDRGQYEKGWKDRDNEIVRCKDCKYAHMTYGGECKYCDVWEAQDEIYLDADFYCAFGERKEDDKH